jgi:type VI secretion system protein ImpL
VLDEYEELKAKRACAESAAQRAAEAAKLNDRGRALCSRVDRLTGLFPFAPDATADASIADVKAILAPGSGELWAFQQESLAPYLEKQGGTWVAKTGGKVELSKSFVDFFNKAADVSAALFAEDPSTPRVSWLASGVIGGNVTQIILRNNGQEARLDAKSFENLVTWPATNGRDADLQAVFKKNKPTKVKSATGDWAIFRLVASADQFPGNGATWNVSGKDAQPVTLRFKAQRGQAADLLTRGWMGRMSCVPQVTK